MPEKKWMDDLSEALFSKTPDYTKATSLIHSNMPAKLYRFGSFDTHNYWEDTISNNKIHVSCPYYFNDPFDCELALNRSIESNSKAKDEFIKVLKKRIGIKPCDINRIRLSNNPIEDVKVVLSHYGASLDEGKYLQDIKLILNKMDDRFKKSIGIVCFSTNLDSVLMWSH